MEKLKHGDITEKVIGAAFVVHKSVSIHGSDKLRYCKCASRGSKLNPIKIKAPCLF